MKYYEDWAKDEMAEMAEQRGLQVKPWVKQSLELSYEDYVTALKQAHDSMDLPLSGSTCRNAQSNIS